MANPVSHTSSRLQGQRKDLPEEIPLFHELSCGQNQWVWKSCPLLAYIRPGLTRQIIYQLGEGGV